MKNILTIAMIALSVGAFAQQRQLVKQQDYRTQTNVRYINNSQYQTSKYSFSRLDLTNRQERSIMRKYRNPEQKLRLLDREYDRKIQNLMSRSQYDKWTKIYAYQYEAYGNKRWS